MKSSNDNNASKSLALDHLGVIAGRLRANMIKCGRLMTERTLETDGRVKTMDEVHYTSCNLANIIVHVTF